MRRYLADPYLKGLSRYNNLTSKQEENPQISFTSSSGLFFKMYLNQEYTQTELDR